MGNCCSDEIRKYCLKGAVQDTDKDAEKRAPLSSPLVSTPDAAHRAQERPTSRVASTPVQQSTGARPTTPPVEDAVQKQGPRRRKDANWSEINAVWTICFDDKNKPKKCPLCGANEMDFANRQTWEIAHVKSFKEGGDDTVANWRPVCRSCNRSMQEVHMVDYCRRKIPKDRLNAVLTALKIANIEPSECGKWPSGMTIPVGVRMTA